MLIYAIITFADQHCYAPFGMINEAHTCMSVWFMKIPNYLFSLNDDMIDILY